MPAERRITISRGARYYALGEPEQAAEVWVACHGYGQLAARFIQHFAGIVSSERAVIAPEGLHRFYLDPPDRPATERRVGATWMTREDRETDIADYIAYLDRVCTDALGTRDAHIVGLGFSQGTATIARWAAATSRSVRRLVLWGSGLPPDLDPAAAKRLANVRIQLVIGDEDEYATPANVALQEKVLRDAGVQADVVSFRGGHRMDAPTLQSLAGT